MFAAILKWQVGFYQKSASAPLWHALVTPDTAVYLNVVAAVVSAIALGFAARRLVLGDKKSGAAPYLVALSFLSVPPFAAHVFGLSPMMFCLLPISLSLVFLGAHSPRRRFDDVEIDEEADLRQGGGRSWHIVVSAAFAAVAAWEGTLGLAFAPLLFLFAWLPHIRRGASLFEVNAAWMFGFAVGFLAEGLCLGFPFLAFKPFVLPLAGLAVFVVIGIIPLALVRRFGENRWTLGVWIAVLAVFATLTVSSAVRQKSGACEAFARAVLADLGERKLIVGDGLTDGFFDLLKPKGVRLVGTRTNADREFLLSLNEGDANLTNKALIVRLYHRLPEMEKAAAELGLFRRPPAEKPQAVQTNVVLTAEAAKSNAVSRLSKLADPLVKALTVLETESAKPANERRRGEFDKARETVRRTWAGGVFRGSRMSNALLMADLMCGDREATEADAITALMLDRNDPAANGALGALRQEEGKFELAERYLRRGVKGGGVLAMGKLAILLIQTDRPAEAVDWARKAVEKSPQDLSLREPLVAALVESGRFDEAKREMDEFERLAAEQRSSAKFRTFLKQVRKRMDELQKQQSATKVGSCPCVLAADSV